MENEKIQLMQVVSSLEAYVSHKEFDKAEAHLKKWLEETVRQNDKMSELALHNEAMIFYRGQKKPEEAIAHADAAIAILQDPDIDTSRGDATVLMNAAHTYRRYGDKEKALFLYVQAVDAYEKLFAGNDERLANIYNSVALSFCLLEEYGGAMDLFQKALYILQKDKQSQLEEALTQLNIASMFYQQYGPEEGKALIDERVEISKKLIDTESLPRDTFYAMVCEKLAAGYEHLGRFDYQKELLGRANRINAMNKSKK